MKKAYWIALAVVVLLGALPIVGRAQKTSRQSWEYKVVIQGRGFGQVEELDIRRGGNWTHWTEDNKPLPGNVDLIRKLAELGSQGWDLVSVIPISNTLGGPGYGHSTDYAGFTDVEQWVLKRAR